MCGISGIVNLDGAPVSADEIALMNDKIVHRGPDDEGVFVEGNLALGHRRLAILDLSEAGHQPMWSGDGESVIVFNGEVYNYLEVREELKGLGHRFTTETDTEVILAAYAEWGEECVQKFNGMWSFALFDVKARKLFCSRDRFGVKPFYYALTGNMLAFGSEIKQLLSFLPAIKANREIVAEFLLSGLTDHREETFFEGVRKLPQASNMCIDLESGGYDIVRYYDIHIDPAVSSLDLEQALGCYREELQRSILIRLRSDVQVGSCLSGGLDSSAVCSLASPVYQKASGKRLNAIHAKSQEKQSDESIYAEAVAAAANLQLVTIEPTAEDFKANIDEVVYAQEEPFGSPSIFMQYFVMQKARALGCKVMLDGQGGDETLLGYEKYYPAAYMDVWRRHGLSGVIAAAIRSWQNNVRMSPWRILKYSVGVNLPRLRKRFVRRRAIFLRDEYVPPMSSFDRLAKAYRDPFDLQRLEIFATNLPMLLRYEDKNSMRHSVEARLPFLDFRALECALNVDTLHKISGGWTKFLLRRVIDKTLPAKVVWRKSKLGFDAPENSWLRAAGPLMLADVRASKLLASMLHLDLAAKTYADLDNRLKWRLFNVACWERIYEVS